MKIRHEFIDNDLRVQNLTQNIIQLEQNLIVAKQTLTSTNPQLQRHTELLESFKTNLEDRREALGKTFDESINEESTRSKEDQLFEAQVKLDGLIAHKEILQAKLDKEDAETIKLGRKQLDIQEEQEQLALTKEVYDTIRRRIQELEMERKRPARISIPYEVTSGVVENKRRKLMIAVIFAAMASGVSLAFLRDKIDLSLHTPEDVVKRVGVQIIGTTTCFDDTEKSLLPEQIVDDYQTICANLGLFNGEGIPKKLMVTSPGPREGKTTLAINLASSLAKTGKRVLLVDGDLRKPDVAKLLSIKQPKNGLQELILGKKLEEVVSSTTLSGLAVLTAKTCKPSEIYELIAQQHTFELINTISEKYDHIIIDSPPILIVSDSLLWAKMVDAAILTSFVNQTEGPDLKEAIKRLTQINVKVLGAVLNNVPPNHSYNSYAYRYASRHDTHKNKRKNREATLLLRGNPKGRFDNSSL